MIVGTNGNIYLTEETTRYTEYAKNDTARLMPPCPSAIISQSSSSSRRAGGRASVGEFHYHIYMK